MLAMTSDVTDSGLLQALLSTSVGVAVVNRELRYTRFNAALAAMNGSDPAQFIGKTVREVVPHLSDTLEPALRQVLSTGQALLNLELEGAGPDAGRSWLEHFYPVKDEQGSTVAVAVLVAETTAQRLEVQRREQALRDRLDAIPHHAWTTGTAAGGVNWYNRRWHDYTGLSEADLAQVGGGSVILHVDDREKLMKAFLAGQAENTSFETEVRLRSKDGRYRWFAVSGEPLLEDGRLIGWIGTNTDVQARVEAAHSVREALLASRRAAERAALAEEASDGFIYEWNLKTDTAERSKNFLGVLGYQPGEIAQTSAAWRELIHADDLEPMMAVLQQINQTGTNDFAVEYRVRHHDGKYRWVWDRGRVTRDLAGQVERVVGSTVDVTERKRNESELLEGRVRLEAALEAGRMVAWEWKVLEDKVRTEGPQEAVYGRRLEQAEHGFTLVHPQDRELHHSTLERVAQEGGEYHLQFRILRPDGSVAWLDERAAAHLDKSGRVERLSGLTMDITEQRQALLELEEGESRFRALADGISQLAWMARADGHIFWYNQRWFEYTGSTPADMEGWGWTSVHDPAVLPEVLKIWEASIATGQPFEMEFPLRDAHGNFRTFLTRVEPLRDSSGQVTRWLGTNTDITERAELESKLRELNEAQRRFVSDAAHELRTPLTAIRGNLSLLARYPDMPPQDRLEAAQDAERESARLTRLITDLLTAARGEAQEHFFVEGVNLERTLREAWRSARSLSERRRFDLGPLENCRVNGDPDALKQLVLALLENAVKYTPDDGTVRLELSAVSGMAEIRVSDTGPGIATEDLQRVFVRFYRTDRARTKTDGPGGTGLGLTIAKQIVERHGGTINLESQLGVGTTAIVRLPLAEEPKG